MDIAGAGRVAGHPTGRTEAEARQRRTLGQRRVPKNDPGHDEVGGAARAGEISIFARRAMEPHQRPHAEHDALAVDELGLCVDRIVDAAVEANAIDEIPFGIVAGAARRFEKARVAGQVVQVEQEGDDSGGRRFLLDLRLAEPAFRRGDRPSVEIIGAAPGAVLLLRMKQELAENDRGGEPFRMSEPAARARIDRRRSGPNIPRRRSANRRPRGREAIQ